MSSKFFSLALCHSSRRNKIGHDLGSFLTSQKNSAVLKPRTGHFGGLAGFEAKDLIFKAKNFKLYPRALHLCRVGEKVAGLEVGPCTLCSLQ